MSARSHLVTSESASLGHPDKVADDISEALHDTRLALGPHSTTP
jgi:S-adenosylmethionine synthetase